MASPLYLAVNPDGTSNSPVTPPTPAADSSLTSTSAQDRAAVAHQLRDPTAPDALGSVSLPELSITDNAPPALKVPAQESRRKRRPGASWPWGALRREAGQWEQDAPGTHGVLAQGVQTPQGTSVPFQRYGNTFRLAPEPWDAQLYIGAAPQPGDEVIG